MFSRMLGLSSGEASPSGSASVPEDSGSPRKQESRKVLTPEEEKAKAARLERIEEARKRTGTWLGATIPYKKQPELQAPSDQAAPSDAAAPSTSTEAATTDPPEGAAKAAEVQETSWDEGDATKLQVRSGPNYMTEKKKAPSEESLYRCVTVDAVRSEHMIIGEVLGQQPLPAAAAREAGSTWEPGCGLPRVLSIVAKVPYLVNMGGLGGAILGKSVDHGCSFVCVHVVKEETLALAKKRPEEQPAAVRLLTEFVKGGTCKVGDTSTAGVLKALAFCENLEEINLLGLLPVGSYNGMPALVTKSGSMRMDPAGEWMEISFDIRMWCYAARTALTNLRFALPSARVQIGMVVQGVEDKDLPEQIICIGRVSGLDLFETPLVLTDTDPSAQKPNGGTASPAKAAADEEAWDNHYY